MSQIRIPLRAVKVGIAVTLMTITATPVVAEDYEVEGYSSDGNYVYGEVESQSGSRDVEGYVYDQDGNAVYFEGEWSGRSLDGGGEIEAYDQEGNYLELETE